MVKPATLVAHKVEQTVSFKNSLLGRFAHRIHTKISVTLPQIEYVSKICKSIDDTELSMHK